MALTVLATSTFEAQDYNLRWNSSDGGPPVNVTAQFDQRTGTCRVSGDLSFDIPFGLGNVPEARIGAWLNETISIATGRPL